MRLDVRDRVQKVFLEMNGEPYREFIKFSDRKMIYVGREERPDLHLDSLDSVELCMMLEEEFGIEISEADFGRVRSYDDIIALMLRIYG
jgi:acyl carrier protein